MGRRMSLPAQIAAAARSIIPETNSLKQAKDQLFMIVDMMSDGDVEQVPDLCNHLDEFKEPLMRWDWNGQFAVRNKCLTCLESARLLLELDTILRDR
jgi:hypothetical protein